MPYMIAKSDQCPMSEPFAVMKEGEMKPMGCHPSEAAAQKQMAALMANEPMMKNTRPTVYDRALSRITEYEFRAAPETGGMPRFYGYAAAFNSDSEPLPFIETITPGTFARTLKNDRNNAFVIDHDEKRVLSSRQTKRLHLAEDSKGLLVESDLPNTSYARDLIELHDQGEIRGMSFTFKPTREGEVWSADGRRRTLTDVRLGHVTVVTSGYTPAYRATTASIRSLANTLGAEVDDLEDALSAIRDGTPLNARTVDLLQSVIAELREQPAETVTPALGVPLSIRQLQFALASKAR